VTGCHELFASQVVAIVMSRCALKALVPVALAAALAACAAAAAPQNGEQTQPLAVAYGATPGRPRAYLTPVFQRAVPAEFAVAPDASGYGVAYYYANGTLTALDLSTARVLWRRHVDAYTGDFIATPHHVLFQTRTDSTLVAIDATSGTTSFSIPHAKAAGAIDGVLFAQNFQSSPAYMALDERTGRVLWQSYGGGMQVNAPPIVRGGVLLQPFVDDGAILEDVLYAFDPKSGHALWRSYANRTLGYSGSAVYVDGTWPPHQFDVYAPITVDTLDAATGKRINSYTYAPDPQRNDAQPRTSASAAYVTGGYVYFGVNRVWYRYDADTYPSAAHPSRLPGVEVQAPIGGGSLLVTQNGRAFMARAHASRMLLSPLGGALQSAPAKTPDGITYALAGSMLYRFDAGGEAHALATVRCTNGATVYPWPGNVAVICDGRETRFADATSAVAPLAITAEPAPRGRLVFHGFAIPPAQGFMKQWDVGPIAPWRDGGVAIALSRGAMNLAGDVAFVTKDGHMTLIPTGHDLLPPSPHSSMPPMVPMAQTLPPAATTVVYDRAQNLWFNNVWNATLGKIDANGHLSSMLVGENATGRPGSLAIRLALGPDGQAWFARSHPTKEIARADGSRTFAIPPKYGDVLVLTRAGNDGLWFVTGTQLVHLSLAGAFTAVDLPREFQTHRSPPPLVTEGAGGTVWLASGAALAQMSLRGTIARYKLPDATLAVRAMVTGCAGDLYIAEDAPEVLRLTRNAARFERYDIDYRELDGLTRTPDCKIWFVTGTNMPANYQYVGTLAPE
jgi:outer membrane protein assembly factor BamB